MPFWKRNAAPVTTNTATTTGNGTAPTTHHEKTRGSGVFNRHNRRAHHGNNTTMSDSFNKRPPFGQWLKQTWLDIVTMIIMGAIGLGVYEAKPAPSRSFPVYFNNGEIVYPEFAYPLRNEIIPIWAAAMLAAFVPIFIFLVMQIRIRSFWDVNNATIGLLYSLITAAVFQVFLKWLIGGLRPHFLAVCQPAVPAIGTQAGNGLGMIMYDRSICTGDQDQIDDSLESFPSGHTTAAFGGFVYLSLYLNAKLKIFSNYHPAMWKLIAVWAPILGATLIGGALTIDEYHNWYDVLAGAIIGTVMAFSSYRMVYAAVWDFRFNHIPLVRYAPYTFTPGAQGFGGFHDAIFTRKAGWGEDTGSFGGAPFDAGASGGAGAASGHSNGHHHNGVGHSNGAGAAVHGNGYAPRHSVERRPVGGHAGDNIV